MAETAATVLANLIGRPLLTPAELLKELNQAAWPDTCYVHPADFLALAAGLVAARDDDGMYLQLANVKIRPKGRDHTLDLGDYAGPDRVVSGAWGP